MGNVPQKSKTIAKFTPRTKKTVDLTKEEYERLKARGRRAVKKREQEAAELKKDEEFWNNKYAKCHAIKNKKKRLQFFFDLFFNTTLCIWKDDAEKFIALVNDIAKVRIENVAHNAYEYIIEERREKLLRFKELIGEYYSETLCEMNEWLKTSNTPKKNMETIISLMTGKKYSKYFTFLRDISLSSCQAPVKPKLPELVLKSHALYTTYHK